MSKLSGIKDLDKEILSKVDDKELLKACSIDKYTWNNLCDDAFLRRRLLLKYPEIEVYKEEGETWKRFFLRAIHYIDLMKEKFDYNYSFGNFVGQYKFFYNIDTKYNYNALLIESSERGVLSLVIWRKRNQTFILKTTCQNGHLEIVKYLVENGVNN